MSVLAQPLIRDRRAGADASRALAALAAVQSAEGCWEGEVVWCPMIAAQMAIARSILGRAGDPAWRAGLRRYFAAQQNSDGGWGLHPLSASTLFVTTLVYVALRLVGAPPEDDCAAAAGAWIRRHPEGVVAIPSWGKIWLAFLDLYGWDGVTPVPPELFLAPRWSPLRPDQLYCHTRYIYLGIAALAGRRFTAALGPLRDSLRAELYPADYARIDFARHRTEIAASDLYIAPGRLLRLAYALLVAGGRLRRALGLGEGLRRRALTRCLELIRGEVQASRGQCLSPVNGLLNLLALWAEDPKDPLIDRLLEGLEAWRWEDEGGIRYTGARSQGWDTAFALQALAACPAPTQDMVAAMRRGCRWLVAAQLGPSPLPLNPDRQDPDGGWCFSDGAHGWPVSDCTAEAVSALLACRSVLAQEEQISPPRLDAAIAFIRAHQNGDGGFGTYERRRGPRLLEQLNPSEMFGQCMTELSYIECTASGLAALCHAGLPRSDPAIVAAIAFLRGAQRADGAWPGFWGINFLYATCFAVRGLVAAGLDESDPTLARAAAWIASVQRADGGWGEHFSGCLTQSYVEGEASLVTSTSWALLALIALRGREHPSVQRGLTWLVERQQPAGLWQREPVNGVFFGAAMLEYPLYCAYFPAQALAEGEGRDG